MRHRSNQGRDSREQGPRPSAMGLRVSHQLSDAELKAFQDATGLSLEQLNQLHQRFRSLDRRQRGYLTPTELLRIPQLAQNPLHRQIIDGFFANASHIDRIQFGEFVRICATFMVPQFAEMPPQQRWDGRHQKLRLLSHMFDIQRRGHIERSDFRRAMLSMLTTKATATATATTTTTKGEPSGSIDKELEEQLQLLEEQAFAGQQSLTYALFEQRFKDIDVESRLAISKWMYHEDMEQGEREEQQEVESEQPESQSEATAGKLCNEETGRSA